MTCSWTLATLTVTAPWPSSRRPARRRRPIDAQTISMKSGAFSTATSIRASVRPSTKPGRPEFAPPCPTLASNCGWSCMPRIKPPTLIATRRNADADSLGLRKTKRYLPTRLRDCKKATSAHGYERRLWNKGTNRAAIPRNPIQAAAYGGWWNACWAPLRRASRATLPALCLPLRPGKDGGAVPDSARQPRARLQCPTVPASASCAASSPSRRSTSSSTCSVCSPKSGARRGAGRLPLPSSTGRPV